MQQSAISGSPISKRLENNQALLGRVLSPLLLRCSKILPPNLLFFECSLLRHMPHFLQPNLFNDIPYYIGSHDRSNSEQNPQSRDRTRIILII